MTFDARAIWAEVKENRRRLDNCQRHRFPPLAERRVGEKVVCQNCGGWMSAGSALQYVAGWQAAGGDPETVMPGFSRPVESTP